jgi:hypothetical protein
MHVRACMCVCVQEAGPKMQVMLKDRYRALYGACLNGFARERLNLLDEGLKERVRKLTARQDISHPRLPAYKRARVAEPEAEAAAGAAAGAGPGEALEAEEGGADNGGE